MAIDSHLVDGFNQPVEIQRRSGDGVDDYGNPSQSYVTVMEINVRMEFLTGYEERGAQDTAFTRDRAIALPGDPIYATDRLVFNGNAYEITAVAVRFDWDGTEHHRVMYLEDVK